MNDVFPPLRGYRGAVCCDGDVVLPLFGEGSGRGLHNQQQLCRSCDFPAQGCGRSTLPWVYIIRYSNSVGVAVSRRRYPQLDSGQKCIGGYYYTHSDNALYQFPDHYPAKGDALGWLVSAVTRARGISHEVTCQLLRGHVSTVTSHQCWLRAMHVG